MKHFLIIAALFVVVLLIFLFFAPRGAAAEGRVAYMDHCATCHGVDGEGDGPMAAVLSVPPPDLTVLAAQNDGVFPIDSVLRHMDGREEVLSHGDPMPLFGLLLDGPSRALVGADGSEVVTTEALAGIATWLREIQK